MFILWVKGELNKTIAEETGVMECTVSKWVTVFQQACRQLERRWQYDHILGGPGRVVELDETCMTKRKYHEGRVMPGSQCWVFGGVERNSDNVFAIPVPDRTSPTLLPVIEQHVAPGSQINTDAWAAYNALDNLGQATPYLHRVVNHKKNFVNPEDKNVHTQSVERFWREFKTRKHRQCGVARTKLSLYCYEQTWRHRLRFTFTQRLASGLLALGQMDPGMVAKRREDNK